MLNVDTKLSYIGAGDILYLTEVSARDSFAREVFWNTRGDLKEPYGIYLRLKEIYGEA
tara:strand:+ start:73 stop:246 length:174 start_codon:yes stop_codon:yes gene_type:complete